jgi:hypothetical protein
MPVMSLEPDSQVLWEYYPTTMLDGSKTAYPPIWPIYLVVSLLLGIIGILGSLAHPKRTTNDQYSIGYDMAMYSGQDEEEFRLSISEAKEAYQQMVVEQGRRRMCHILPRHTLPSADAKTKGLIQI